MKHECSKDIMCLDRRPHMWFYGGWVLERPDHTTLRIWQGKLREGRRGE